MSVHSITPEKLFRLVGTAGGPRIVDVRDDAAFAADPRLIPGAVRRPAADAAGWGAAFRAPSLVAVCADGAAASPGVAAWLRHEGKAAESLAGGVAAWAASGLPMVRAGALPPRDARGRTVWVTRARPKVDRIACPWLIRRFVDPDAAVLFVPPADVAATAARFGAAPFDVDGAFWSHRGEECTFDTMVREFGLAAHAPLARLALIVRGADTARLDLAPEAAGLLAASLGLSRMHDDDQAQLDAGMVLYDSFYRWLRDAAGETHDWTSHQPKAARPKGSQGRGPVR